MSNTLHTVQLDSEKKVSAFFRPVFHLLAIAGLVFLIYSNTFDSPFLFDDTSNIVNHPAIKDFDYFTDASMIEGSSIPYALKPLFRTRYIGYLSFAANYALDGLNVRGYHLVNIVVHAGNAFLLYWFMTLTFRTPSAVFKPGFHEPGKLIAVFIALFFAVHPIQTQAVTYIVQRFTSLATLFYLLSFVMYIKFRYQQSAVSGQRFNRYALYVASLISAALAMKTKEFAVTLPVMLGMYDYMFYEGRLMKRLLYLIPFFIVTLLIPLALTDTGGALSVVSGINEEALNLSGERGMISRGDYLLTQFRVIVTYVRLLLFPVNQNIDYDYPVYSSVFDPAVVLSLLFLLAIVIAGIYLFRLSKRSAGKERILFRLISFGIFWFFIALFPESGVVPIIDVIFEHRVYLPSIGFFMAIIAGVGLWLERWGSRIKNAGNAIVCVTVAALLALAGASYARNGVWQDSISLWENAAEGSPNKARPHHNLGIAYAAQGRVEEATREFQTALQIYPYLAEAHYDLGVAYAAQGRFDEAVWEYQSVLKLMPNHARARNNLALTYMDLGKRDDAIKELQILLQISPDDPMVLRFLEYLQKK